MQHGGITGMNTRRWRRPHCDFHTALVAAITAICDEFEAYGWRRVRAALRQQGVIANHKRIRRLMREHALQPEVRRRFVTTTDSNHDGPIFPDLAKDMVPSGRDQLWVADLTMWRSLVALRMSQ